MKTEQTSEQPTPPALASVSGSASGRINAPFTMEQVKYLREWQRSKFVHPFTCCNHITMEVSTEGFICPKCGIIQTWCHAIMAEPMRDSLARMQNDRTEPLPPKAGVADTKNI